MSSLLILGAGGHGKVVAETAEAIGGWESIAFLDDDFARLNGTLRWPVVGSMQEASGLCVEYVAAIVAIGHTATRLALLERIAAAGFEQPFLIHPMAWLSPSASVREGSVVFAQGVIHADACLGRGVIVNTSASVEHDCVLADGVHVCPGAHMGGGVKVGESSWLGIGCTIKQGIRIGKGVTVGAGAVVLNDVPDDLTVAGCPAQPVGVGR